MKTSTNNQKNEVTITDATDLGLAMLIAEDEAGRYEPVAAVSTLGEAREIASHDLRSRSRRLEQGQTTLCPSAYKVWANGFDGHYRVVGELTNAL